MPSTVIARFAYRPHEAALDVEFTTGRVYRYFGVPPEVAQGLRAARSKGGWFNRHVRDAYSYEGLRGGWQPPDPSDEKASG